MDVSLINYVKLKKAFITAVYLANRGHCFENNSKGCAVPRMMKTTITTKSKASAG